MTSLKNKPLASAILAVYNSELTLVAALSSLLTQTVPLEIIVIDDGSTDQTKNILKQFPNIIRLEQSHGGPALARNLGAKHATTKILLFVDADMTFAPDYVANLIKPIENGQIIGTYTIDERVSNWDNIWARCWNIQEGWDDETRFPSNPPEDGTDYRAILKSEFDRVGGFDNIGYTDTWSLFLKLGVRPRATNATCYHKNPDTLKTVYLQARWAAKRPYRLGYFGSLYALLRTSLPCSIIVGLVKALTHLNPQFFVFKLVYDYGRFMGIAQMLITGKLSK